jgi:hypothetical protein
MESEAMNVVIPSDIAETTRTSSSSANNLPTLSGIFFCVHGRIRCSFSESSSLLLVDMNKTISYINRGVELGQPRLLQRAIRQNVFLRRSVTKELLSSSLKKFIPSSCPTYLSMKAAIQLLPDSAQIQDEEIPLPTTDAIPEVEVSFFDILQFLHSPSLSFFTLSQ